MGDRAYCCKFRTSTDWPVRLLNKLIYQGESEQVSKMNGENLERFSGGGVKKILYTIKSMMVAAINSALPDLVFQWITICLFVLFRTV